MKMTKMEQEKEKIRYGHKLRRSISGPAAPSWLLFLVASAGLRHAVCGIIAFENAPKSSERDAAAEEVDDDEPGGKDISEVMEKVGI
jgi:hypothetical protein